MKQKSTPAFPTSYAECKREFIKTVQRLGEGGHAKWEVFADFCQCGANAFANAIIKHPDTESAYLRTINKYTKEERQLIPQLLALTTAALEYNREDFLGQIFQDLELSNHWKGQYFTPQHICDMMAGISMLDAESFIKQNGFMTIAEPSMGSGAMIIGIVNALVARDINYQQCIFVSGIDLDITACNMAMIQLSLLHVPAILYNGNTLSMEMFSAQCTPSYYLGLWGSKLRHARSDEAERERFRNLVGQVAAGHVHTAQGIVQ